MKRISKTSLAGLILSACFLVAACSVVSTSGVTSSEAQALLTAEAANPLPTEMAGQGLVVGASTACLVKQDTSISMSDPQGDLLAWSPMQDTLAYVRPDNGRWAWFVGDLAVYDFKLSKEVYASTTLEVFGDLTWSPDGGALAYVVLDPSQKTYTVRVADMATGGDKDVFAGSSARTDDWSSTKGITNWASSRNVVVTSSCGLDCARIFNFNTETDQLTISGDERKKDDTSLTLTNEMTSPDGSWQVAVDTKDNLWLSKAGSGRAFILIAATPVSEIKWSEDSKYLALRTAEQVSVYQMDCK